jgi:thymidine kinase
MGYLEIIGGCMFAKKTTELINIYNKKLEEGEKVLAINYDKDTRYGLNKIISHDGLSIPCIPIHSLDDLYYNNEALILDQTYSSIYIHPQLLDAKYIFINEAQFFLNLKSWVLTLVEKYDKNIILCGLDSDFRREKFGEIIDLIPHANKFTKLYGLCSKCPEPSLYTHRLSKEIKQEVIGSDNYTPLCRRCYIEQTS